MQSYFFGCVSTFEREYKKHTEYTGDRTATAVQKSERKNKNAIDMTNNNSISNGYDSDVFVSNPVESPGKSYRSSARGIHS